MKSRDETPPPRSWLATEKVVQSSSRRRRARLPTRITLCAESGPVDEDHLPPRRRRRLGKTQRGGLAAAHPAERAREQRRELLVGDVAHDGEAHRAGDVAGAVEGHDVVAGDAPQRLGARVDARVGVPRAVQRLVERAAREPARIVDRALEPVELAA
jgi:hypothetical protein